MGLRRPLSVHAGAVEKSLHSLRPPMPCAPYGIERVKELGDQVSQYRQKEQRRIYLIAECRQSFLVIFPIPIRPEAEDVMREGAIIFSLYFGRSSLVFCLVQKYFAVFQ